MYLPWLYKNVIKDNGEEGSVGILQTLILHFFKYLCEVDYATNEYIHASISSYNEVMRLLKLKCGETSLE